MFKGLVSISLLLVVVVGLFYGGTVFAEGPAPSCVTPVSGVVYPPDTIFCFGVTVSPAGELQNPTRFGDFPSLICGIFSFLNVIARPLGMIFVVIAGIKFVTARGNEQKLTEAKGAILWAVIGFFVLFLGGDLVNIVADITGLTSGTNACP